MRPKGEEMVRSPTGSGRSRSDFASLRVRLPLVVCSLVVIVLSAFMGVSYSELRHHQVEAAMTRARLAAEQIASLMATNASQRRREAQEAAASPAVTSCVSDGAAVEACNAAREALRRIPGSGLRLIEGWDGQGRRALGVPSTPQAEQALYTGRPPEPRAMGVQPIAVREGVLYADTVVEVAQPTAPAAGTEAATPLLVVRRALAAAAARDLIARLIGQHAVIRLGNRAGDVWTDFETAVAGPAIDLQTPGGARYLDTAGAAFVGALAEVIETPWVVWVEFPEAEVLAPAASFARRMLLMAVAFLIAATLVGRWLSQRITNPLGELTELSEAIAGGAYSQRVQATRSDEIGRLGRSLNIMADHIERQYRELESRVAQRTASLAAVNQELEAFSYSVSHDLRAPLRHVAGFASLLEESAGPRLEGQDRRYLSTIRDAASRMGQLIDALLSLSRTSRSPLNTRRVNLTTVLDEARREVQPLQDGRAVTWALEPLPEVEADAAMLRIVFTNLLSNALKYTAPHPTATIAVSGARSNGEVTVTVRDDGVGFDPQFGHKLFDVFQRLHSSDDFEGTGIGLATVRRIVQRHGGRVWAESAPGQGAAFSFTLPARGGAA
jgi:signal transduction histidine kinase